MKINNANNDEKEIERLKNMPPFNCRLPDEQQYHGAGLKNVYENIASNLHTKRTKRPLVISKLLKLYGIK